MPFDPTKPADLSPLSSEEMRDQLNALHAEIQAKPTAADLNSVQDNSSHNSNAVTQLNVIVSNPPQQWEVQAIADKLVELITALRR